MQLKTNKLGKGIDIHHARLKIFRFVMSEFFIVTNTDKHKVKRDYVGRIYALTCPYNK